MYFTAGPCQNIYYIVYSKLALPECCPVKGSFGTAFVEVFLLISAFNRRLLDFFTNNSSTSWKSNWKSALKLLKKVLLLLISTFKYFCQMYSQKCAFGSQKVLLALPEALLKANQRLLCVKVITHGIP